MYNKNKTLSRKTKKSYTDDPTYGYSGKPVGDNTVDSSISVRALRNLPHSSYSFAADPYAAALPTSEPYPLLNKFNKVVGGSYGGERNIDGGNVQQYANSTTSKFLKYFDVFRTKIAINYRYLPIAPQVGDSYTGKNMIDEMRKSIAEAVSILKSTTYTQLAISNFAVITDLPMGSADTEDIFEADDQERGIPAYTNLTDVLYAMSIYYQLFLQEGLSTVNAFNSFRLKQGVAIKNAYNREVPLLNGLFGLFNKKSFLNLLESINLSYQGEYIDTEFMRQVNMLTTVPSRRSNSITDPVLELQVKFNRPSKFKVVEINNEGTIIQTVFDDSMLTFDVAMNGSVTPVSFWSACDQIKDYMSLEATQLWARSFYSLALTAGTDTARFNKVKALFDVVVSSFTKFKPLWADYRENLDLMVRTGTVSWTKGFRPSITSDTDVQLFWNVMVDHIYQLIFSGSPTLIYDDATKRWKTFTLWNMYSGTPEYDMVQGGSFLSFSFKTISASTDSDSQRFFLPVLFDTSSTPVCVGCSRDGVEAVITLPTTPININGNIILSRLAPLSSQSGLTIRIPTVTPSGSDNANLTDDHYSTLYKTLTQVFGLCRIRKTGSGAYDVALDPDLLSIYQVEISDVTNLSITYARAHAPFKGTVDSSPLGFASLKA